MTTSETGSRRAGFTLIEILVVISLIVILVTVFVSNFLSMGQKAYVEATRTLLRRLELGMDSYRDRTGFYPPDGLDGAALSRTGKEIRSAACLHEFLGLPLNVEKPAPGGRKIVERYTSPMLQFRAAELEVSVEDPSLAEVADAWEVPIHYDRLEGENSYSVQDSPDIHLNPPETHPPDPREVEGGAMTLGQGQNPGKFDLWSHGLAGHVRPEATETGAQPERNDTICNWRKAKE